MKQIACLCSFFVVFLGCDYVKKLTKGHNEADVAYTIGGQAVTTADVYSANPIQLFELERRKAQLIREAAAEAYLNKFFADEAAKKGGSPSEARQSYLAEHAKVTDSEVDSMLSHAGSHPQFSSLSPGDKRESARNLMLKSRAQQVLIRLVESAKNDGKLQINYQEPPEPQVKMDVTSLDAVRYNSSLNGQEIGGCADNSCPVTVVELTEFTQPYSAQAYATQKRVIDAHKGKIRWVARQLPSDYQPLSKTLAIAALCAQKQGRYWYFADALFAHQATLKKDVINTYAAEAGLNVSDFTACVGAPKEFDNLLTEQIEGVHQTGVYSTPTYIINGKKISGMVPFESLDKAILEALANKR